MLTINARLGRIARMVAGLKLDMAAFIDPGYWIQCDRYIRPIDTIVEIGNSYDLHAVADVERTAVAVKLKIGTDAAGIQAAVVASSAGDMDGTVIVVDGNGFHHAPTTGTDAGAIGTADSLYQATADGDVTTVALITATDTGTIVTAISMHLATADGNYAAFAVTTAADACTCAIVIRVIGVKNVIAMSFDIAA